MPDALDRKYPHANKEWGWYWVFPAAKLSIDPRSGIKRRHHFQPDGLQRDPRPKQRPQSRSQSARLISTPPHTPLTHPATSRPTARCP